MPVQKLHTGRVLIYAAYMDHMEWLSATAKDDSSRAIGKRSGVSFRTIADQIDRRRISAENVIAIAIGYGRHPVTALIDCDYLPAKYATEADPIAALRKVSEDALADEVLRRLKLAGDHTAFTTPVDELIADRESASPENGEVPATLTSTELDAITTDAAITELEVNGIDDDRDETG